MSDVAFVKEWNRIEVAIHDNAVAKGHHDPPPTDLELIAHIHSEISEAFQAIVAGNPLSTKIPGWTSLTEELADAVMLMMDMAYMYDLRLPEALLEKLKYNKTRRRRHGRKK